MRNNMLALALLICFACQRPVSTKQEAEWPSNLSGELTITGAYALMPLIQACADSFSILYPQVRLIITPLGSELAMNQLENGKCDLAMISRPITGVKEERLFTIPVSRTGVVLVFNKLNPYRETLLTHGLTIQDLQSIFNGEQKMSWDKFLGKKENHVLNNYTRADPCGTAEVIADFLYLTQFELKGIPVEGEHRMIEAVLNDPLALGYCNMSEAFDLASGEALEGLEFLPLDLNCNGSIEPREAICNRLEDFQNSVCMSTYPFRLSRNLYLVALEKPKELLVSTFLLFVVTESQTFIKPLGYSELPGSLIKYNLYLLKE